MKYLKRFNESSKPEYNNIDITGENFMEIFEDPIIMSQKEIDQISDIWENSVTDNSRKVRISGNAIGLLSRNVFEVSICKVEDDWFVLLDNRSNLYGRPSLWKCDTIMGLLSKIMEICG